MPMSFATMLFRVLLVLICAAAFRWGGRAERQVAVMYVVATILSHVAFMQARFDFDHFAMSVALVDGALLIGLLVVTVRFNRWWLIAASAMQILTCMGHTAKLIGSATTSSLGYFMMLVSSSYPALTVLAIGIWQHHRSMRIRS